MRISSSARTFAASRWRGDRKRAAQERQDAEVRRATEIGLEAYMAPMQARADASVIAEFLSQTAAERRDAARRDAEVLAAPEPARARDGARMTLEEAESIVARMVASNRTAVLARYRQMTAAERRAAECEAEMYALVTEL